MQTTGPNTLTLGFQLRHRCEHIKAYVKALQSQTYAPPIVALWNLRALQDEAHLAGLSRLCTICSDMEILLILQGCRMDERLLSLMDELSKAVAEIEPEESPVGRSSGFSSANEPALCIAGDGA